MQYNIMCVLVRELKRFVKQNTHLETSFLTPLFYSLNSIFCLITAFLFFFFICFRIIHAHKKCIAMICICRIPWLVCHLLFWGKWMKAIWGSIEWILISPADKCISSLPWRGYESWNGLYLNPSIHSIKQKEGIARESNEYLKNFNW